MLAAYLWQVTKQKANNKTSKNNTPKKELHSSEVLTEIVNTQIIGIFKQGLTKLWHKSNQTRW
jgi:hypothetical protein